MRVALVLHLYQPPVQEEAMIKQIASECYLPLLKVLKNKRNHKFTLNIPLSLLELMDKYGYSEWINDVKVLYESGRIELVGSAAYHPLLTKLPQNLVEEEIILNEYGLGYYFGSKQGFEGESSIMIKNIQGFFPPELALNNDLVDTLDEFGYGWVMAEETAVKELDSHIFAIKDKNIKIVCRDKAISNVLSFKREENTDDLIGLIKSRDGEKSPLVIALDGEFFGHHFKEGFYLLSSFLDGLERSGITLGTVSEILDEFSVSEIDGVQESSWGASKEEFSSNQVYPLWFSSDNVLQKKLWDFQEFVTKDENKITKVVDSEEFSTLAVWIDSQVSKVSDEELQKNITKFIYLHKFLNSDKFWWASKKEMMGKVLFHPGMINASLDFALQLDPNYQSKIDEIHELLK